MRILVADDETEMTDVLEALLSREHYAVDIVHDGQDALDYGLTGNYDCLVPLRSLYDLFFSYAIRGEPSAT